MAGMQDKSTGSHVEKKKGTIAGLCQANSAKASAHASACSQCGISTIASDRVSPSTRTSARTSVSGSANITVVADASASIIPNRSPDPCLLT